MPNKVLTQVALQPLRLCYLVKSDERGVADGFEGVVENADWSCHVVGVIETLETQVNRDVGEGKFEDVVMVRGEI